MLLRINPAVSGSLPRKEQQDIDDVFGSLVEGCRRTKIEGSKESAKVDIQEWLDE